MLLNVIYSRIIHMQMYNIFNHGPRQHRKKNQDMEISTCKRKQITLI